MPSILHFAFYILHSGSQIYPRNINLNSKGEIEMAFESLFEKYDRLVLFDTETTGLQYSRD